LGEKALGRIRKIKQQEGRQVDKDREIAWSDGVGIRS